MIGKVTYGYDNLTGNLISASFYKTATTATPYKVISYNYTLGILTTVVIETSTKRKTITYNYTNNKLVGRTVSVEDLTQQPAINENEGTVQEE